MLREIYQSKENRDSRYREFVLRYGKDRVFRSSVSNQCLHPQYVADYPASLSSADCGFGNTIYKTHFSKLYKVEVNA